MEEEDEVFWGPVTDRELLRIAYLSAMIATAPKVAPKKPAVINIQPLLATMRQEEEAKIENTPKKSNPQQQQQSQQLKAPKPKSFLPVPTSKIKVLDTGLASWNNVSLLIACCPETKHRCWHYPQVPAPRSFVFQCCHTSAKNDQSGGGLAGTECQPSATQQQQHP